MLYFPINQTSYSDGDADLLAFGLGYFFIYLYFLSNFKNWCLCIFGKEMPLSLGFHAKFVFTFPGSLNTFPNVDIIFNKNNNFQSR